MSVIFLNLPSLPDSIKSEMLQFCNNIEMRKFINPWLKNFHKTVNIAAHESDNERTRIPLSLSERIISYYKPYFQEDFFPAVLVADHMFGSASKMPPHCDKMRYTAVNYLLSAGGDSVTTTFYQESRTTDNLDLADHLQYENVTVDQQHIIPTDRWYAFNAQKFHSVENITGRRCVLVLLFLKSNPNFQEFVDQYPALIQLNNSGVMKTG